MMQKAFNKKIFYLSKYWGYPKRETPFWDCGGGDAPYFCSVIGNERRKMRGEGWEVEEEM